MEISIIRLDQNDTRTLGVMKIDGQAFCCTLENPWKNNTRNISCIPEGTYDFCKFNSQHHGMTIEILGVPGRDKILVHVGNVPEDTEGCILVGEKFGDVRGQSGIQQSKPAMIKFRKMVREKLYDVGKISIVSIKC